MSKQPNSNVIHVNFKSPKAKADNGTQPFNQLLEDVVPNPHDNKDEFIEKLTPSERSEQLRKDLDFLLKMDNSSSNKS
jgi:hypothetical protein